ncbi:response regulator [Conexibacter woesei]|uniref:Two component transcriptional regulator, LuxR family n=1 Tax=Conexibacter woesei (strain DSM 14684 / CCUG 47730 / CIP 108061 / JCM 11494 / NBRC 100937 / ID131577) TaxID=469383 RepID=D3F3P0_CONWI|nr:response regulator transcription factor [Conexibacter woesei]ADB52405.1 two component transcriptional regulator, LuxR family [Conexibacter woesei DSM 14684]
MSTPPSAPVRVMLVDDDELVRRGLGLILSSDPTLELAGEAADGDVAVRRAVHQRPDVVLMDVRMPVLDGIAATRELIARVPAAKVVILTTFEEDDYVIGALRAGASGFLLKRSSPEDLRRAIHTVAAGDALLSPSVTRRVIDRLVEQPVLRPSSDARLSELTPREQEVLLLMAQGLSNREIVDALAVEETTVKSHVRRVLSKLGVRDRVHAVILAYESGLVSPGGRAT